MSQNILDLSNLPKVVNDIYLEKLFKRRERFIILFGGSGSGKSVAVAQMLLLRMIKYGTCVLGVREVGKTIKNSMKRNLDGQIRRMNLSPFFTVNENEIKCNNGAFFIFSGLDDENKLKSIADVDIVWVEEATETREEAFKEINRRLRGGSREKQIIMTLNPDDYDHYIRRYFFAQGTDPDTGLDYEDMYKIYRDKAFIMHTTYKDNKFLDDSYIEQMENEVDDHHREIYTNGNWHQRSGKNVFDGKMIKKEKIPTKYHAYDRVFIGIDFGWNHASTCIVVGINLKTPNILYVVDELYLKKRTTEEFVDQIMTHIDWYGRVFNCDSAEPDRIKIMTNAGMLAIAVKKFPGSKKFALDWLRKRHIVCSYKAPNTYRELKGYRWKLDARGIPTDEPEDKDDDCIAGMRYAILDFARNNNFFDNNSKNCGVITSMELNNIDETLKNNYSDDILSEY